MKFAELHCASAFSFLEGASQPEDLVDRAVELELPAVALVDRNTLSGAPRFWKAARDAGIKPLVGAEIVLDDRLFGIAVHRHGNCCGMETQNYRGLWAWYQAPHLRALLFPG